MKAAVNRIDSFFIVLMAVNVMAGVSIYDRVLALRGWASAGACGLIRGLIEVLLPMKRS